MKLDIKLLRQQYNAILVSNMPRGIKDGLANFIEDLFDVARQNATDVEFEYTNRKYARVGGPDADRT